jgi:hypothetical protein
MRRVARIETPLLFPTPRGRIWRHSVQTANARCVQALDRSAERVRSAIG